MSNCCGEARRCTCIVTAGPGVTVDGGGSKTNPYVVSAADTGAPTALTVTDSSTVDLTLAGTGTTSDPYNVTAAVILDPTPPGGGLNLIEESPDGIFVECAEVRQCFSAGNGAGYDPETGVITARPSTDAGNTLAYGTDGGLLIPAAEALTVGCGLQGGGTAAAPLAAFPIAGEKPWADDWDCDAVANSTLKCDPDSGALWTPPEHASVGITVQQNHPMGTPTFTDTGGYVLVGTDVYTEGVYTADSLSTCRGMTYTGAFMAHVEATWTAGAVFDLGYAVSINGGAPSARLGRSQLQAGAVAGHERWSFGVSQSAVLDPHVGYSARVYPLVRVTAGSVTLNQWITDLQLLINTR